LTGVIGGGKSHVAALLGQRGAAVIDADSVGHNVLEQADVRRKVIKRFGRRVLKAAHGGPDGAIDRNALGSIVFADPAARRELEAIMHPEMLRQFEAAITRHVSQGVARAIILDAAILLEAGWDQLCDLVVFVDASFPVRLERVAQDRGWTAEVLRAREAAQWPAEVKRRRADIRIRNDASPLALEQNVDLLIHTLSGVDAANPAAERVHGRFAGRSYEPVSSAPGDAR
jgi:dephospho-CoA kinase